MLSTEPPAPPPPPTDWAKIPAELDPSVLILPAKVLTITLPLFAPEPPLPPTLPPILTEVPPLPEN